MAVAGRERRVDVLARPKPMPPVIEDRRSVYWVDRRPLASNGHTLFVMTPRLEELASCKKLHDGYIWDRPTSTWPVSETAKQASISERISSLANPRLPHHDYQYDRSVYMFVTPAARTGQASARLDALSTPKPHKIWRNSDDTYCEGEFNQMIWPVSDQAQKAECSARVQALAEPKHDHPQYLGERCVQWRVTENAINSVATLRLQQLARPKSGRLHKDDYDPYRVSVGAKNARPTPRLTDLALPIPRKVQHKKV